MREKKMAMQAWKKAHLSQKHQRCESMMQSSLNVSATNLSSSNLFVHFACDSNLEFCVDLGFLSLALFEGFIDDHLSPGLFSPSFSLSLFLSEWLRICVKSLLIQLNVFFYSVVDAHG